MVCSRFSCSGFVGQKSSPASVVELTPIRNSALVLEAIQLALTETRQCVLWNENLTMFHKSSSPIPQELSYPELQSEVTVPVAGTALVARPQSQVPKEDDSYLTVAQTVCALMDVCVRIHLAWKVAVGR